MRRLKSGSSSPFASRWTCNCISRCFSAAHCLLISGGRESVQDDECLMRAGGDGGELVDDTSLADRDDLFLAASINSCLFSALMHRAQAADLDFCSKL